MNNTLWGPIGDYCYFENGDRGVNYPNKNDLLPVGIPFLNAGDIVDNKLVEVF